MTNKEFAEKNAGKYFLYKGMKVQVVGYYAYNSRSIMVALPWKERELGWGEILLEDSDVLVMQSEAPNYEYVEEWELSVWE